MHRTILLTLAFVMSGTALGQASGGQQEGISGKASLGYLATSGNTDSTNASGAFQLHWVKEVWSHEFDLSAITASNAGVTTAESYAATYAARRALGEQSYLFAALDWEQDQFSSYDSRTSESVGYGRKLVDTERHALSTEFGLGARQLDRVDGIREDEGIVRLALDYGWTISDTTGFSQKLTVESGDSNTNLVSVTELRARLFGDVALVLSYRIKHNTDVLPGIEKTDRFTAISLEYAF